MSRFALDGTLLRRISLPTSHITNVCFGELGLDRLFWLRSQSSKSTLGCCLSMDIDISFVSCLELYRADVAERRVPARRDAETLHVVKHI